MGSKSKSDYGVRGLPTTVLIDPEGKLVWSGHPSELTTGTVKKALKGAKKPKGGFLSVRLDEPAEGRAAKAASLAGEGSLAAALKDAEAIAADERASEAEKAAAQAIRDAIVAHGELLAGQAEQFVKRVDIGQALDLFDTLAKEFAAVEVGSAAKKRADEIRGDEGLMHELDAAKALESLKKQTARLSSDKKTGKVDAFVKKWSGTKAAERAKLLLRGSKG